MNSSRRAFFRNGSILLLVLLLISAAPGFGAEALNYRYELGDNKTLDYWFSKQGMRMDFREGDSEYSIIHADDAITTITHEKKQAVKLDRAFLERMVARMEQMRKKLENLPRRQRKMMEKSMGDAISSLEGKEVSSPSIVNRTGTEWNGRAAVRGDVTTGGETVGSVVLLEEPPLPPSNDEVTSLRNFQSLMEEFIKVTGSVAETTGSEPLRGNQSFHLLGERLLRLAEYESPDATIRLTDWERRDVEEGFFSIPEGYTVQNPSQSMGPGSMRGGP